MIRLPVASVSPIGGCCPFSRRRLVETPAAADPDNRRRDSVCRLGFRVAWTRFYVADEPMSRDQGAGDRLGSEGARSGRRFDVSFNRARARVTRRRWTGSSPGTSRRFDVGPGANCRSGRGTRPTPTTSCRTPCCRRSGRLGDFDVRGPGALQAYLRQAILNRVRDELRKKAVGREEPVSTGSKWTAGSSARRGDRA